jgi:hypothetical protein
MRKMGCLTAYYSTPSALGIVGAVWLTAVHQSYSKSDASANLSSQTFDMMTKICDS